MAMRYGEEFFCQSDIRVAHSQGDRFVRLDSCICPYKYLATSPLPVATLHASGLPREYHPPKRQRPNLFHFATAGFSFFPQQFAETPQKK